MENDWYVDGQRRWCRLALGGASIMLQQFATEGHDARPFPEKPGEGITLCFQCEDAVALYHEFKSRGLNPSKPRTGNQMWVTDLSDPDGYRLFFESPEEIPKEPPKTEWRSL
jgi:hypothetical protein